MKPDTKYDVAVIGGGHNGLTCACYLAKAGLKTIVLERRHIVGGAVCTEDDLIEGYKIDVGSSAHIMIHLTPVVKDLELEKFGLVYIDCDPFAFAPMPEGKGAIYFWRDVDKTCESIARISPEDADRYKKFVAEWEKLNEGVFEAFLKPPTMLNLGRHMIFGTKSKNPADMVRKLMTSYGALVKETFKHEGLRAAMAWLAAQSGPPPTMSATGDFLGWHSMIHKSGVKRPRGGSGALTQAMARCLEHHGGEVLLNAEVAKIEVENNETGRIILENGERVEARRIVSNAHVHTTFLKLIGAENLPAGLAERIENVRIGNGFGMIVRCAVSELPDYIAAPNVKNSIIERVVQSPLDLEQRLGLLRGNVMHVEMDFDQMFLFRPLPEMSAYKTPIKNLYLTGASTHPGGGVFAASGYNTAQVVLKDVKGGWW